MCIYIFVVYSASKILKNNTKQDEPHHSTTGATCKSKVSSPRKMSKTERKSYETKRLKKPDKRFGGLTEEHVQKLLLPDHLAENLDVLFVS